MTDEEIKELQSSDNLSFDQLMKYTILGAIKEILPDIEDED